MGKIRLYNYMDLKIACILCINELIFEKQGFI